MEIRRKSGHFALDPSRKEDFHILTFAETGFAMLNIYGEIYGVEGRVIEEFAKEVNRLDEPETLLPVAPLSAIPSKYIRGEEDAPALTEQIVRFLAGYAQTTPATCLLMDFRAGLHRPFVVEAMETALRSPGTRWDHARDVERGRGLE